MPLYIDHHKKKEETAEAVAKELKNSRPAQDMHEVNTVKSWFNKERGEVYYLFEAPDKKAAEAVHHDAHDNVEHEIVEVTETEQHSILARVSATVKQALIPNRASQIRAIRILVALTAVVLILLLVSRYGPGTALSARNVARILSAVAWPTTVMVALLLFFTPIRSLLNQLANSLKIKVLKFKLFGAEAELSVEEAQGVLDEMLQEIVDAMNEVTEAESKLFKDIAASEGDRTVLDFLPHFERENIHHVKLKTLRDRQLIRPVEGGKWQKDKHPVVTRFGRLVQSLHPKVQRQQNYSSGSQEETSSELQ